MTHDLACLHLQHHITHTHTHTHTLHTHTHTHTHTPYTLPPTAVLQLLSFKHFFLIAPTSLWFRLV